MLCGDKNDLLVSTPVLQARDRLILECGGKNRITDGPAIEPTDPAAEKAQKQ